MKTKRTLNFTWLILLLLTLALPVWAQEASEEGEEEATIVVDTTVQGKVVDDDSSKAEEYGEVPEGFLINHIQVDLSFKDDRYLNVTGDRVRLNNGAYGMEYGVHGEYKLYADYLKIPHLFSKSGETIWTETSPGVWEIPDNIQSTIQALNPLPPEDPASAPYVAAQKAFVSNLLTGAHPVSLNIQRNRGNVGFEGTPGPNWKYDLDYFQENRDGYRPFGTSLGFSWVTELPETIDYRTQNLHGGLEYNSNGKLFAVTYDYNRFTNENQVMIWDNPLRITDYTYPSAYSPGDGTSRARVQLPADNTANTIGFQAAANFGKSKLSGSVNYSVWTDEVDLLPFTINTAIPEIPLPSGTFNGDIKNLNLNLNYYTRFGDRGTFTARYRLYDQSNNGDNFHLTEYVRFDQVLEEFEVETSLFEYSYNTLDFDVGFNVADNVVWHASYGYNARDYEHREVNKNTTNAFKTSLDWLASESATVRFSYQYAQRRFDEIEFESSTYLIIPLRRYDVSDVNLNVLRGDLQYSIGEKSSLGFNASYSKNDYQDAEFGLQNLEEYNLGVDYSYSVSESSSVNLWYEYQSMVTDQKGRQSGATPSTDPLADWTANIDDKYNTLGLGFTTGFKENKAIWDTYLSYAMADGEANLDSPPGGTPNTATSLFNADDTDLFTFKTSVSWKCTTHTRIAVGYWFEMYEIDDYAEDTIKTDLTPVGAVLLNAIQPDYQYHVGWISLIYNW